MNLQHLRESMPCIYHISDKRCFRIIASNSIYKIIIFPFLPIPCMIFYNNMMNKIFLLQCRLDMPQSFTNLIGVAYCEIIYFIFYYCNLQQLNKIFEARFSYFKSDKLIAVFYILLSFVEVIYCTIGKETCHMLVTCHLLDKQK